MPPVAAVTHRAPRLAEVYYGEDVEPVEEELMDAAAPPAAPALPHACAPPRAGAEDPEDPRSGNQAFANPLDAADLGGGGGLDGPRPPKRERERESFLERVTHRTLAAQLRLEDQEIYGFAWEPDEKKKVAVAVAAHFAYWLLLIFLDPSSFVYNRQVDYYWWGRFFAQSALLFGAWILIGLLHHKLQLKVNYSRKICHIVLFIMPMFIMMMFGKYDTDVMSFAWLTFGSFFQFYMFIKPVRRFLPVPFLLMFQCIDRPEDRPYTVPWLVTQSIGGFAALIVLVIYLQWKTFSLSFLLIPMVVNGLGDGLAEPVGVRFGRHKYVTRALFYQGKFCFGQFQRSLEGSACVFVSALASVLMLKDQWASDLRFYFAPRNLPHWDDGHRGVLPAHLGHALHLPHEHLLHHVPLRVCSRQPRLQRHRVPGEVPNGLNGSVVLRAVDRGPPPPCNAPAFQPLRRSLPPEDPLRLEEDLGTQLVQ